MSEGVVPDDAQFGALLEGLTAEQRAAVVETEGPVLVVAAAGSGKTRVITRRMAYLISLGVPSWQILALTFTNKAAGEMRERAQQLLGSWEQSTGQRPVPPTPTGQRPVPPTPTGQRPVPPTPTLTVTTFHSLCARLLRKYAALMHGAPNWSVRDDYSIYDSDDQVALMKRVLKEHELQASQWPPRSVLGQISDAKNRLEDAETFEHGANDFHSRSIAKLFTAYQAGLRKANAVDFDDLLSLTVRMLRESDEARSEVQGRWRYLMIDEYQDTNHAQFVLATLLCGRDEDTARRAMPPGETSAPNICVVGDPDQSIYGWRGADIGNILDFSEHYPGAKTLHLGQNFRSTASILGAADGLIRHNKQRIHKDLYTTSEGGENPMVVLCRDEHHESEIVVDWLERMRGENEKAGGTPAPLPAPLPIPLGDEERLAWKDMAVFYRNNALSRVMEDALRATGIPYIIARGTAFYQREEVRDLIAYLRVLANPADDVSLRRIINKPSRKIGKTSLTKVETLAVQLDIPLFEALRRASEVDGVSTVARTAIERFVKMIDSWSGGGTFMGADVESPLATLVDRVARESSLQGYYRALSEKSEDDDSKTANLDEVVSSAAEFEEKYDPEADPAMEAQQSETPPPPPPLLAMLRAYLESVALIADADKVDPAAGAVTLMTLHAAKGLEFSAVAMIGLEEGLLPSYRALESDGNGEEERRLCFVGITRAMRHLLISSAKYRTIRGLRERTIPSRFLEEIPSEFIQISDQSEADEEFGEWDEGLATKPGESLKPSQSHLGAGAPHRSSSALAQYGLEIGCRVRHGQFGLGEVKTVSGRGANLRAVIVFRDVGTKTLVLQYAKLERA